MIKEFVAAFDANRELLLDSFREEHPRSYQEIVRRLVTVLRDALADVDDVYSVPDPERIHVIDDGDYQGTLVFVIGETGYQPRRYWATSVGYGSCSHCDTLAAIHGYGYDDEKPTEEQARKYFTLALHLLQRMKGIDE